MKHIIQLAIVFLLCFGAGAQAQEHPHDAAPVQPAAMSTGEVFKVDKSAGKITLRHGPLVNLGMSGMTMPFSVAEPGMLDQVKPGDKVRFVAEEPDDTLTIVKLELAK